MTCGYVVQWLTHPPYTQKILSKETDPVMGSSEANVSRLASERASGLESAPTQSCGYIHCDDLLKKQLKVPMVNIKW